MLKCVNAAFIVLKDQLSTNKLKLNGDKAPKESHMKHTIKTLNIIQWPHNCLSGPALTFKTSYLGLGLELNAINMQIVFSRCYWSPVLCVLREVMMQRREREGLEDVMYTYIIKPFTLPVIMSDSLRKHCKRPQIHSLIEHTVITVKLSLVGTWKAMETI